MNLTNQPAVTEPLDVLGLARGATEEQIRSRYLELVKQYPPEREPERFRQIRAAFAAANEPLLIAEQLIEPPHGKPPKWSDVIETQKNSPPSLSFELLLSLGNRPEGQSDETGGRDREQPLP